MEGRDPQRSGRSPIVGVAQPTLRWSVAIEPPSFGQPVFAADGTIYVGTSTGKVAAFTADGKPAWEFAASGPVPTPAVGPDGTVYARGGDGSLFALQSSGRRRWTTDIGAPPLKLGPAPIVGPDNYGYLTSYQSSMLYFVQPGGFFQWAYNAQARTLGGAAVGPDGVIYFGAADGKFWAIDRELNVLWSFNAGAAVVSSPAVDLSGMSGRIFVMTRGDQGGLLALDQNGRKLWSTPACWEAGAPVLWPAVAPDGGVQVANCAIAPDGRVRWKAPLGSGWATPSALDADGNVYFGAGRALVALGPDGSPRWSLPLEGEAGPPSIGTFGSLVFTSRAPDRLYALGR